MASSWPWPSLLPHGEPGTAVGRAGTPQVHLGLHCPHWAPATTAAVSTSLYKQGSARSRPCHSCLPVRGGQDSASPVCAPAPHVDALIHTGAPRPVDHTRCPSAPQGCGGPELHPQTCVLAQPVQHLMSGSWVLPVLGLSLGHHRDEVLVASV